MWEKTNLFFRKIQEKSFGLLQQRIEKVLIKQAVQKFRMQGAKKVQGRGVFRHTLEFELFVALPPSGDSGRPAKPYLYT
jgi:hypothetical protein